VAYSIPENLIEEIRDNSDIVDIISETVLLKRRGKNFVGLCPFHTEKTASFTVSPDNQMYYCFGCGEGGNVYSFLMKYHGLDFIDAVKTLADRAGIQLPAEKNINPAEKEKIELKKRLLAANELACAFYHHLLKQSASVQARDYLKQRKITWRCAESFKIGWSPAKPDQLSAFLISKGYSRDELIKAGLSQIQNGSLVDCFRSRILFPICDYKGRVLGFGGRVLGSGEPKYLNTGETDLFQKGHVLYALHAAIPTIRSSGFAVIVEGYTDVIAAHQAGIKNVVASLGTAFTREQAKLIRRYAENVIMAYDADSAGSSATLRSMDILAQCRCKVRVAPIPEGYDPDSFISAFGGDAFLELVKGKSLSLVEYRLEKVCNKYDISNLSGRLSAANEIIPSLVMLENDMERDEYIKLVSQRLSLSSEAVAGEVMKYGSKMQKTGTKKDKIEKNRYTRERVAVPEIPSFQGPESILVWGAVCNPDLIDEIQDEIGIDAFSEEYLREILYFIKTQREKGKTIEPKALLDSVLLEESKRFISQMTMRSCLPPCGSPELAEAYILNVKKHILEKKIIAKKEELTKAQRNGNVQLQRAFLDEINDLLRLKESLCSSRDYPLEGGE